MKVNLFLNEEEIELIFESLNHLYLETDRAMKYDHVDYLSNLKEHFLNKKKNIKDLLKRIKN